MKSKSFIPSLPLSMHLPSAQIYGLRNLASALIGDSSSASLSTSSISTLGSSIEVLGVHIKRLAAIVDSITCTLSALQSTVTSGQTRSLSNKANVTSSLTVLKSKLSETFGTSVAATFCNQISSFLDEATSTATAEADNLLVELMQLFNQVNTTNPVLSIQIEALGTYTKNAVNVGIASLSSTAISYLASQVTSLSAKIPSSSSLLPASINKALSIYAAVSNVSSGASSLSTDVNQLIIQVANMSAQASALASQMSALSASSPSTSWTSTQLSQLSSSISSIYGRAIQLDSLISSLSTKVQSQLSLAPSASSSRRLTPLQSNGHDHRRLTTSISSDLSELSSKITSMCGSSVSEMLKSQVETAVDAVSQELTAGLSSLTSQLGTLMTTFNTAGLDQTMVLKAKELRVFLNTTVAAQVEALSISILSAIVAKLDALVTKVTSIFLTLSTRITSDPLCLKAMAKRVASSSSTSANSYKMAQRIQELAGVLGADFCFTVSNLALSLSGVKFNMTISMQALDGSLLDWEPKTTDSPLNSATFKKAMMMLGRSKSSQDAGVLKMMRNAFGFSGAFNSSWNLGKQLYKLSNSATQSNRRQLSGAYPSYISTDGTISLGMYSAPPPTPLPSPAPSSMVSTLAPSAPSMAPSIASPAASSPSAAPQNPNSPSTPTKSPSAAPQQSGSTSTPTKSPSTAPTSAPSKSPSTAPTTHPSQNPTKVIPSQ